MLPADASLSDRILWAGLAAIVGTAHDGPEVGTEHVLFERLEAAARTFGVPADTFDECARALDFHYYRPWDCYLSREALAEAREIDGLPLH